MEKKIIGKAIRNDSKNNFNNGSCLHLATKASCDRQCSVDTLHTRILGSVVGLQSCFINYKDSVINLVYELERRTTVTICCRKDCDFNNTTQKSLLNNLFILINTAVGVAWWKKGLDIQAQLIEACTEVTE